MTTQEDRVEVTSEQSATPTGMQTKETYVRGQGTQPPRDYQKKKQIFRVYQVIWYILGVLEILLAFRILLKAVGANAASGFSEFIYLMSTPFAYPFLGVFGVSVVDNKVIEWPTFLAMVVYLIVAFGLVKLFQFIKPVSKEEVEKEVDTK